MVFTGWWLPDVTCCMNVGAIRYLRHIPEPANSICFIFVCALKPAVQFGGYLHSVRTCWLLLARRPLRKRQVTNPLFRFSTKHSGVLVCWCNPHCRCTKYARHANRPSYKFDGGAEWMSSFGSLWSVAGPAECGVQTKTVYDDKNHTNMSFTIKLLAPSLNFVKILGKCACITFVLSRAVIRILSSSFASTRIEVS